MGSFIVGLSKSCEGILQFAMGTVAYLVETILFEEVACLLMCLMERRILSPSILQLKIKTEVGIGSGLYRVLLTWLSHSGVTARWRFVSYTFRDGIKGRGGGGRDREIRDLRVRRLGLRGLIWTIGCEWQRKGDCTSSTLWATKELNQKERNGEILSAQYWVSWQERYIGRKRLENCCSRQVT